MDHLRRLQDMDTPLSYDDLRNILCWSGLRLMGRQQGKNGPAYAKSKYRYAAEFIAVGFDALDWYECHSDAGDAAITLGGLVTVVRDTLRVRYGDPYAGAGSAAEAQEGSWTARGLIAETYIALRERIREQQPAPPTPPGPDAACR